ncbi:MAG: PEP-CTERM sorting domain-containing protein [Candidatus Omnitrophica bacterium]|nr:PEP-CTERM sorting domain-containing protein [Candidatus Omnitrophota bacterium]
MRKTLFILVAGLVLGLSVSAHAALIDLGMVTGGGELRLYQIYNSLYGTSLVDNDALEALENNALIAGGLYSSTSGVIRVAARYAGATVTLKSYDGVLGPGAGDVTIAADLPGGKVLHNPPIPPAGYGVADDDLFGVWGETEFGKFYSEKFRNIDNKYHFAVFNTPDPDKFLVGFEDRSEGADWDYNDFVFETENLRDPGKVIPEPASMLLFGMGILGLFGLKRKA